MTQNELAFIMYFLITLICGVALLLFFRNVRMYADHTPTVRFLSAALLCASVIAFSDLFYAFWVFNIFNVSDRVKYAGDTVYALANIWGTYFWLMHSEYAQSSCMTKSRALRGMTIALAAVITVITLLNPFYPVIFSYTSGIYRRGPLFIWLILINALTIFGTGLSALIRSFLPRYYVKRSAFRDLFLFTLIFLFAQAVQYLFIQLPIRTLFFSLVFFIAQSHMIKSNIYRDRTAQINNRLVIDNYLSSHFDSADRSLCFGFLDIEDFHGLNDRFGPEVGDKALLLTAKALKATAGAAIVARYDNDSFAFSGNYGTEREIEVFLASFRKKLKQLLLEEQAEFDLDFYVGYARKTDTVGGIPELINRAGLAVNRDKKSKKKPARAAQ